MKAIEYLDETPKYGVWGFSKDELNIDGVFYFNTDKTKGIIDFYGDPRKPLKWLFVKMSG